MYQDLLPLPLLLNYVQELLVCSIPDQGSSLLILGINHQSPLIHFRGCAPSVDGAGNQSPIPFDTLGLCRSRER